MREARQDARENRNEDPIPGNWEEYLQEYCFTSPLAKAMAATLLDSQECHPTWFKEAEIAVGRKRLDPTTLTYEKIRDAVVQWRNERYSD